MAYNNYQSPYQPVYYPQPYQQPQAQYQPQAPAPQQSSGIVWVQGEAGAKSYLVAPNCTVQLWDSEKQCIYLKSADASGMPQMKILDYTIRDQSGAVASPVDAPAPDYATRGDIEALTAKLTRLRADLDEITNKQPRKRKEVYDDE